MFKKNFYGQRSVGLRDEGQRLRKSLSVEANTFIKRIVQFRFFSIAVIILASCFKCPHQRKLLPAVLLNIFILKQWLHCKGLRKLVEKEVLKTNSINLVLQLDKDWQKGLLFCFCLSALLFCFIMFFCRFTKERPRFSDELEIMKFVCKEVWQELFQHQADKLQTNHAVSNRLLPLLSSFLQPFCFCFSFAVEISAFHVCAS